ncbi:molecular chaperone DnaJ [Aliiglaciecola sp.]|nr:molecular chaperone DnaJ [Aliiglaciecola sp.]
MSLYKSTLADALFTIFVDEQQTLKEHQLISLLQSPPYELFNQDALSNSLTLFRCHFVLFHHLYILQNDCHQKNIGSLSIHTTKIELAAFNPMMQAGLVEHDPIKAYYLDCTNFDNTDRQHLEDLIDSFWKKMASGYDFSEEQKLQALASLDLQEPITQTQLKSQYRLKQHIYHPDKGGDEEISKQLLEAYQLLKKVVKHT